MTDLNVERFTGSAIAPYVPALAELRIRVFREWPYLYDGDMEYEAHYLDTYSRSSESLFVLVFDAERIVGASTGMPMADETEECKRPFRQHGYDPEHIFYFGESVLLPEYRGRGIGVRFFTEREDHARKLKRFTHAAFCGVQRPDSHARRPPDYVPLDDFWSRRGYVKHPELATTYSWKDVDEARQTPKPMTYWLKVLEPNETD